MAEVLTVNLAVPRDNPAKSAGVTGIDKQPADGPVAVRVPGARGDSGLAGDQIFDREHHGGDDQAVYAYAREDLDGWQVELGRPLRNGGFGENLTTAGLAVNEALIGERWRIGSSVELEVSAPRIPCGTFAHWMAEAGWVKRFTAAAMPGAYLRVITPGEVRAGDPITVLSRPAHEVSVAMTFRALTSAPELLPRLVDIDALPVPVRQRARRRVAG